MISLNIGCGTHRAPEPWVNVDTVHNTEVRPDVIVNGPLPFADLSCERVLLSHVLEHVPWEQVPSFLVEVRRVAAGEVLIVGPDLYRAIEAYKNDTEPWHIVASVMEHKNYPDDMAAWPGAPHHWNCHEARVLEALTRCGFDARPADELGSWPLVGWNPRWQFAVTARKDSP